MRLCLTHYSGTLRNLCQSSEAIRVSELSIFIHLTGSYMLGGSWTDIMQSPSSYLLAAKTCLQNAANI